jgi:hypothetical protein
VNPGSTFPSGCVAVVAANGAGVELAEIDRLVSLRRHCGRPPIDLGVRDRHHPLIRNPDLLQTLVEIDDRVLEAAAQDVLETGVEFWQAWASKALEGPSSDWRYEASEPIDGVPPYFCMTDAEWQRLRVLFFQRGGTRTVDRGAGLAFSVSDLGVWPNSTRSYHPTRIREYATNDHAVLSNIAACMLERRWVTNGGRFFVYRLHVVRADTRQVVLQLGHSPVPMGQVAVSDVTAFEDA